MQWYYYYFAKVTSSLEWCRLIFFLKMSGTLAFLVSFDALITILPLKVTTIRVDAPRTLKVLTYIVLEIKCFA